MTNEYEYRDLVDETWVEELHDELVALADTPRKREVFDLIAWHLLVPRYDLPRQQFGAWNSLFGFVHVNMTMINSLRRAGRHDLILAGLLHERAHEYMFELGRGREGHSVLFAAICWGLQQRAGVESDNKGFDCGDEWWLGEIAQKLANHIARCNNLNAGIARAARLYKLYEFGKAAVYAFGIYLAARIFLPVLH